jgi:hypothetical protein
MAHVGLRSDRCGGNPSSARAAEFVEVVEDANFHNFNTLI